MSFPRPRRLLRPLTILLTVGLVLVGAIVAELSTSSPGRAAAPAVQAAAVTQPLIVGLSEGASGWGGASTAPRLKLMLGATHAKWLRDAFWWYSIERARNRFSFAYYDHYMLQVGRLGLHVVPQLVGTPRWAGGGTFSVPANPRSYAGFVAAVLHRYGVGGTFWRAHPALRGSAITAVEVWNEPYFDNGNGGRYDPGRYARLLKATSIATHAVDPSAKLLMEAEMEPHLYNVWRWWVDSLYRAMPSLNRYFSGVAVHDFGSDVTHLSPIRPNQPYANFGRVRRIEDLRRQFVRHHAANKPFWIMETGWSTCHVHSIDCVSEAQQQSNLSTLYGYLRTRWRPWVQAVFVYRFGDGAHPSSNVQDGYGLLRGNGTAKPALQVFRTMVAASSR
jgi:hypothetical protein